MGLVLLQPAFSKISNGPNLQQVSKYLEDANFFHDRHFGLVQQIAQLQIRSPGPCQEYQGRHFRGPGYINRL